MERNPFKWPLSVIGAILIWCTDVFFNIPALLLWPSTFSFSPLTNYNSDLGRTIPDPSRGNIHNSALGGQYYNTGQVF